MPKTCECTASPVAIVSPLSLCDKQQLLLMLLLLHTNNVCWIKSMTSALILCADAGRPVDSSYPAAV